MKTKFFIPIVILFIFLLFIVFSVSFPFSSGNCKQAIANEINESESSNRIAEQSSSEDSEAALEVEGDQKENKVNAAELNQVDNKCSKKDSKAEENVEETPPEGDPNSQKKTK